MMRQLHKPLLLSLLTLFALLGAGAAAAACSPYHGFATINEIHRSGNNTRFVELKLLDESIPASVYDTWSIEVCSSSLGCTGSISVANAIDFTKPWLVIDKPYIPDQDYIELDNGTSVILRDGSGATIDFTSVAGYTVNQDSACTPAYDWTAPATNTHTVKREPDGAGDWAAASGNSEKDTTGDTNDDASLPVLSVDDATVLPGQIAVFTISLDAAAASDVQLHYQSVDDTALAGTDYTAVSGTLTLPAGTTSATVSVPTNAGSAGGQFYLYLSAPVNASIGDHFGLGRILEAPLAYYPMDEPSWNGTAGEVADATGNGYDGTALYGAGTDDTDPALSGDVGTCGYGDFNGWFPRVRLSGFPDLTQSFTIAGWVRQDSYLLLPQAIFSDYTDSPSAGYVLSMDGGWSPGSLALGSATTAPASLSAPGAVASGSWTYLSVVHDATSQRRRLYVNGGLVAEETAAYTGAWSAGGDDALIGAAPGFLGFWGAIDELRIFQRTLDAAEIAALMGYRHSCPAAPPVDHYEIVHDGEAVTCAPEQVTVRACADAACSSEYTGGDVTVTLSPTGWVGGDTKTFTGSGVFELRHTQVEAVTLGIASASPAASTAPVCSDGAGNSCELNFRESGFIYDVPDNDACAASNAIAVRAVRTLDNGSCGPAFQGSRSVQFSLDYVSPGSGATAAVLSTGGTDYTIGTTPTAVDLAFDANAEASIDLSYADAGQVALKARYEGSGEEAGLVMLGSDGFVATPALALDSPDAGAACAAGDASCTPFVAAGDPFNLRLRAVCPGNPGQVTPNFAGSAALALERVAPNPANPADDGDDASVDAISLAAADGGQVTVAQSVNDVGVYRFHTAPVSYLGTTIPAAASDYVGRFYPASLAVSLSGGEFGAACNSFSYVGQPFGYATAPTLTVTARNRAGATTQNYTDAFWKLPASVPAGTASAGSHAYQYASNTAAAALIAAGGAVDLPDGSAAPGTASVAVAHAAPNDTFWYQRPAGAIAPFDPDARLTVSLNDGDATGIGSQANIGAAGDSVGAGGFNAVVDGYLRYGRLVLSQAYGPETLPLQVPVAAQYYDGNGFVANGADNCTALDPAYAELSDYRGGLAAGETTVGGGGALVAGQGSLTLSAPGADAAGNPNSGSVRLDLCTAASGAVAPCDGHAGAYAGYPWLRYDWDTDGGFDGLADDDPKAEVTFGIYRGSDNLIYMREVY